MIKKATYSPENTVDPNSNMQTKEQQLSIERCRKSGGTYRDGDLAQDVLWDVYVLLMHLLIELIQRGVHQLHADPHITLTTQPANQLTTGV